jgi:hypothetical protein
MKTATTIREDIAIVLKELADMRSLCTNEKREPNEDERKAANGLLSRIDELEDMLALENRTQATLDRSKELRLILGRKRQSRKTVILSLLPASFIRQL